MWKIVIILNSVIPGTNGCHKYVWGYYKTKREAEQIAEQINDYGHDTGKYAIVMKGDK